MKVYDELTSIYDLLTGSIDYEEWIAYLFQVLHARGGWEDGLPLGFLGKEKKEVKTLDLACGTGSHSLPIAARGYPVIGLDISPAMTKKAEARAAEAGVDSLLSFQVQDIRHFCLMEKVQLAIAFHDGLNYLLEPRELRDCFRSVFMALEPGGCFFFDLNQVALLKAQTPSTEPEVVFVNESDFSLVYQTAYDEFTQIWEVNLTGFIREEDGRYRKFQEVHREKAYAADWVIEQLETIGFDVLGCFHPFSLEPARTDSRRIFILARVPC